MAFYYPEGQPGPICDAIISAAELEDAANRLKERAQRLAAVSPQTQIIDGPRAPNEFVRWPLYIECKVDPETGELFDCQNVYGDELSLPPYDGATCIQFPPGTCFDWVAESTGKFGLDDIFFVPNVQPFSCIPWDPDVNIRPVTFITQQGTRIVRYSRPRSSPVTYPVNAVVGLTQSSVNALFSDDGRSLVVTGEGVGAVTIQLKWDDDPNTNGTAVDTISLQGKTWTQVAGDERGKETHSFDVEAGQTYSISFTGLNSANSPISVTNGGKKLCLKDGDGNDCNAEFTIISVDGGKPTQFSLWNDAADKYGVWTNPAQCTLPCLPQTVVYKINFPEDDLYFFEIGNDDAGEYYFDDEQTPFATALTGSMLNENFPEYTGPVTVSKEITAGEHTLKVVVTNGARGDDTSEILYVDNNPSWGSITLGSGTAIRQELDGPANEGPDGPAYNELGGFDVPSDSPTGKYLSFGTIDIGPTIFTRTAQITMDLRGVNSLSVTAIAGTDGNGGERPNDLNEVLEINLGLGWIVLAPSKQYGNYSFAEYDNLWGFWKDHAVSVPESARVENATIFFRSFGDKPEIGGEYFGLSSSQVENTYGNCGDIFGIYRISKNSIGPDDCANPSESALSWAKNPGGWYIKICKGAPCKTGDFIPWVPVWPGGDGNYDPTPVLKKYGVWPEQFDTRPAIPQEVSYKIYVQRDDTLELEFSADDQIEMFWDGVQVGSHGDWRNSTTASIPAVRGLHTITMIVTNRDDPSGNNTWQNNPAAGAFELRYSDGKIIRTSLDLTMLADENMIWNTRMAVGYEYISDCETGFAQSTYGTGFVGYMQYVDGSREEGEFITALKPQFANQVVTSASGFSATLSAIAAKIIVTYNTKIHRYPEPFGFDGWIANFQSASYPDLNAFTAQIYQTYLDPVPIGSGEYIHQQSKGGVVGNYDACGVRRI